MSWLEIILKEVFAILPRILCYLFLWKTITKQLNNQRKLNEEHNTIIILNSTTRNILHFNSTNCSHFSTDLILAISCGTIHKLINKYLLSIYYMLTSAHTCTNRYLKKTDLKIGKSLISRTLVGRNLVTYSIIFKTSIKMYDSFLVIATYIFF